MIISGIPTPSSTMAAFRKSLGLSPGGKLNSSSSDVRAKVMRHCVIRTNASQALGRSMSSSPAVNVASGDRTGSGQTWPKNSSGGVWIGDVDETVPEEEEASGGGQNGGDETSGTALSTALMLYSPKSKNVEAIIGHSCWHTSTVRCAVWR